MVFRYLFGQVYCVRCGYQKEDSIWRDSSGHPRCASCRSRVRTRPRSSRLKTLMREEIHERELLAINNARLEIPGTELVNQICPILR